jgi:hypothetical protein
MRPMVTINGVAVRWVQTVMIKQLITSDSDISYTNWQIYLYVKTEQETSWCSFKLYKWDVQNHNFNALFIL